MATKHDVQVTEATASATVFRAVCACSCGWSGAAQATSEPTALAEAARARVEHLLGAHPGQAPSAFLRPRAHARYLHPRSVSVATAHGRRWSRHAACACGWTDTVRAGSPEAAARAARARHTAHVQLQTGRTPTRDYLVLVAVVLVVAAIIVAMALAVVEAAGGTPSDLLDLGGGLG